MKAGRSALGILMAVGLGAGWLASGTNAAAGCDPGPCPLGSWYAASDLQVARSAQSATQLADGRVLVVGGAADGGPPRVLTSTEFFDPHTDTWSNGPPLTTGRTNHTATPIGGHRLLVVGGIDSSFQSTATAEIFDPSSGNWKPAASLAARRYDQTATLLAVGDVLVVGGTQVNSHLASAERYDPSVDSWSAAGALATGRTNHTATLLPSGKVLVVGGLGSGGALSSAELFDPSSNNWSPAPPMTTARAQHTATLLTDGRVLVAGGVDGSNHPISSAEIFDPAANSWVAGPPLSIGRAGATATLLGSGQVLVVGGRSSGQAQTGRPGVFAEPGAEVYDPQADAWTPDIYMGGAFADQPGPTFSTGRVEHTATALADGRVLVAGGVDPQSGHVIKNDILYQPNDIPFPAPENSPSPSPSLTAEASPGATAGSWTPASHMSTSRYGHTATLLQDGRVLVAGGAGTPFSFAVTGTPPDVLSSAEIYDPSTNTWSAAAHMSVARYHHTATPLGDGRVLVVGGASSAGVPDTGSLTSAEIYDPSRNTWSAAAAMAAARNRHTATLLSDGRVLVAGGVGTLNSDHTFTPLSDAEIYDPKSNSWAAATPMVAGRYSHTATLLNSGQVIATGGGNALASTELYDPAANTWTLASSMNSGRTLHTATMLSTGKLLVAGGLSNQGPLASTELYDPAANSWSASGSMNAARYGQTSTLLPNGQVMGMCGGGGTSGEPSVESYDPTTGTWTPARGQREHEPGQPHSDLASQWPDPGGGRADQPGRAKRRAAVHASQNRGQGFD